MNEKLINEIYNKIKLYSKYNKEQNKIKKEQLIAQYKDAKRQVRLKLQLAKGNYYKRKFINNQKNALKTWKGID